jgi:hypothetical protein
MLSSRDFSTTHSSEKNMFTLFALHTVVKYFEIKWSPNLILTLRSIRRLSDKIFCLRLTTICSDILQIKSYFENKIKNKIKTKILNSIEFKK